MKITFVDQNDKILREQLDISDNDVHIYYSACLNGDEVTIGEDFYKVIGVKQLRDLSHLYVKVKFLNHGNYSWCE